MEQQLLEAMLQNQDERMIENNKLLEVLVEQTDENKKIIEQQKDIQKKTNNKLDELSEKLTVPALEVKREDIKIDTTKIEESIDKLLEKINEPVEITLSIK